MIVMVSNGPGELSTWVRPLAEALNNKLLKRSQEINSNITLRLVLVPCPNATGKEAEAAKNIGLFELITPAKKFWNLLIRPKVFGEWPSNGLVIFLGGDQFWSVLLSARLGYLHMTYAEWVARWPQWNDRIAAMSSNVRNKIPKKFRHRCTVVGDLMADLPSLAKEVMPLQKGNWIALMPGSKKTKLCIGVPFLLEVADHLAAIKSEISFLLPVAPTTNLHELQNFTNSKNPIAKHYKSGIAKILPKEDNQPFRRIVTIHGNSIHLHEDSPAHDLLSQCELALTTVGANTAELGALCVPMIVIVPTQHLNVMQAWDGFLGIIARTPILKKFIGLLIGIWRLRNRGFLAWPNIAAGRMVVPEKVGKISPIDIAKEAAYWIESKERLNGQREDLRALRGRPGAAGLMADEIIKLFMAKNNR